MKFDKFRFFQIAHAKINHAGKDANVQVTVNVHARLEANKIAAKTVANNLKDP